MATGRDVDLDLEAGRVRAWVWGPPEGRLVVGVPGLSANSRSLAAVAERLAAAGWRFAALDLRGRAHSEVTVAGTYGWPAHARDVVAAAAALEAEEFDVVGHSMGAYVAMQVVADHPAFAGRIVLVDAIGAAEQDALGPILGSVQRLERTFSSVDELLDTVRAAGTVRPWSQMWEDYYRYDVAESEDGSVRTRTSHAAVMEDVMHAVAHPPYELWARQRVPILLLRAGQPLGPNGGMIVSEADRDRFAAEVPDVRVVEIEANHYGVIADPASLDAIDAFLA